MIPTLKYDPAQELRILTLWQPWASLMAWGEKRCETRPRPWSWRGWVAIHASARKPYLPHEDGVLSLFLEAVFRERKVATQRAETLPALPRGKILAVLRFNACYPTPPPPHASERERAFGDFGAGRFFFTTSNLQELKQPVPWKGGQGLRIAPPALREIIARELAR